jgi:hypothetical protein
MKDVKKYIPMVFVALLVSALVVWMSNNVDAVEDAIG